jgi:hypothetical protein
MKLLNCIKCHDIIKLHNDWRFCVCGKAAGRYLKDGRSAQVYGTGRIVGIDNNEYIKSFANHNFRGEWFLIFDSNPKIFRCKNKPPI